MQVGQSLGHEEVDQCTFLGYVLIGLDKKQTLYSVL